MIIEYTDKESIYHFLKIFDLGGQAEAKDIEKIKYNTCTGEVDYTLVQPVEYLTQTVQIGKVNG